MEGTVGRDSIKGKQNQYRVGYGLMYKWKEWDIGTESCRDRNSHGQQGNKDNRQWIGFAGSSAADGKEMEIQ